MTPALRRILAAAAVLVALSLGFAGLVFSPAPTPVGPGSEADVAPPAEAPLLTETQARTFVFFNEGRVAGGGRGLFETDFFKPAPPPPPKPKPTPPTTREIVLFYRGLASFPDGGRVAYLSVEDRAVMLELDAVVVDGWRLVAFDSDTATLAKAEARVELRFNRRATLSVPAKP